MSQPTAPAAQSIRPGAFVIGTVIGDTDARQITTKKGKLLTIATTQVLADKRFVRCTQMFQPGELVKTYRHNDPFVGEIMPAMDDDGQLVVNTRAVTL